jgi:hypothetical protein
MEHNIHCGGIPRIPYLENDILGVGGYGICELIMRKWDEKEIGQCLT